MPGAHVEIRGLRKSFEHGGTIIEVLRGIDVELRPGELSGGEQQRVALARALILEPKLLLADEPTGNLDSATGEDMHKLFVELNRERGMTMLVVTHNNDLAGRMPRRLRMSDGGLLHEDSWGPQ